MLFRSFTVRFLRVRIDQFFYVCTKLQQKLPQGQTTSGIVFVRHTNPLLLSRSVRHRPRNPVHGKDNGDNPEPLHGRQVSEAAVSAQDSYEIGDSGADTSSNCLRYFLYFTHTASLMASSLSLACFAS